MKTPPVILSIAGSDCSGGAGIQADIKTISALGGYAASVITAVTVQNTLGVQAVYPLPAEVVRAQIEAVMDDLQPEAIKIGMVHDASIVAVIVECLQKYRPRFVVYDPVMISTSGRRLMTDETIELIQKELFSLCTLITPNLSEASLLCGNKLSTPEEMEQAAGKLSRQHSTSVLIKGGHLEGNQMCDVLHQRLCSPQTDIQFPSCTYCIGKKIKSSNLHGTGCTLSSAIPTYLAQGKHLKEAVSQAKEYISKAIDGGKDLNIGHGNGPLWHFSTPE